MRLHLAVTHFCLEMSIPEPTILLIQFFFFPSVTLPLPFFTYPSPVGVVYSDYLSRSLNAYKERRGIWKEKSIKEKPTDSSVDQNSGEAAIRFRKPMVILERKLPITHFMR